MNAPGSGEHWSSTLTRAAWTLLFVAIAAYVAWQLLRVLIVPLIVVLLLVWIIRYAIGGGRIDRW